MGFEFEGGSKVGSVLSVLFFMLLAFMIGIAIVAYKGIEATQALMYAGIGMGILMLLWLLLGGKTPSILKA